MASNNIFEESNKSWNSYLDTKGQEISNASNQMFSVDTTPMTNEINKTLDYMDSVANNVGSQITNLGTSAKSVINGVTSIAETEQYVNLAQSVVTSASNVAQKYIDQLLSYFTEMKEVPISAIMEEIAPYAMSLFDSKNATAVTSVLKKNVNRMVKNLHLDSWTSFKEGLSEEASNLFSQTMNDKDVQSSLSQLSVIKTYASTLETITNTISTVEMIVNIINPLLPIVRMVSNFALSGWSGGTTAAEAATEATEETEKYGLQLVSVAIYYIKKYTFGIKIKVPKILVSELNIFSVKTASIGFDLNDSNQALVSMLFNDDYYTTAMISNSKSNTKSTAWLKAVEDTYEDTKNWTKDQIRIATTLGWGDNPNSDTWWQNYKSQFVTSYMSNAIKQARSDTYGSQYTSFGNYYSQLNTTYDITGKSSHGYVDFTRSNELSEGYDFFSEAFGIIKDSKKVYENIK